MTRHEVEDEVLFKVLEMQSGIADKARKMERLRPASAALDRALKEGKIRAKGGQPAGLLACASVRLQSCAMLSRFEKHAEALEEACAAVLEMDRLWKDLTMANGHAQAAARDNKCVSDAMKKVPAGLRELILKPPPWLEQAVSVSAEAKHCVAIELEYVVQAEGFDRSFDLMPSASAVGRQYIAQQPTTVHSRPSSAPAGSNKVKAGGASLGAEDDVTWALSVGSAGVRHLKDPWGLIERLHAEALALCEFLLQDGHPTLERSRTANSQARSRNPAVAARMAAESQDAADEAAREARLLAAKQAERKAAEEAARRAAEEEAARRAAEEAARIAALWHPKRELAEERAEQIVEHRQTLEPKLETKSVKQKRGLEQQVHEERVQLKGSEQKQGSETKTSPQGSIADEYSKVMCPMLSVQSSGASARSSKRSPRALAFEESPRPTPRDVAVDFLKQAFADSSAGAHFQSFRNEVNDRHGVACLETETASGAGMLRPASALTRSPSVPSSVAERPASAGFAQQTGQRNLGPARNASFPAVPEKRDKGGDIFKEWKANQSSYNQLSYIQKKIGSERGVEDMKTYFRKEQQRFVHGYLKEVSQEVLYDNRVNFTPSMVAERKRQELLHPHLEEGGSGASPNTVPTALLSKAMRRTWVGLYGFRDDDCSTKKKHAAKDFGMGSLFNRPQSSGGGHQGRRRSSAMAPGVAAGLAEGVSSALQKSATRGQQSTQPW